jgi:hypothetical protein
MQKALIAVGLIALGGGFANGGAQPVATVSSEGSFSLRGVSVSNVGVSRWPVMAGDTIVADTASVIRFRDGSVVLLNKGARAVVGSVDDAASLRLISGTMQVDQANGSRVVVSGSTPLASRGIQRNRLTAPGPMPITPTPLSSR